jgi:hypothetical protein
MDTMERLQIQKHHQEHRLIPEQKTHEYNPLFQLLYDTRVQLGNTGRSPPPNGSLTNTHSKHTQLMCDTSRDYKRVHASINGAVHSQQHILAKLYSAT